MTADQPPCPPAPGTLLIISGPSGAGKTTITRAVEREIPGAVFSVSATTRACAPGESHGRDYWFVSDGEFDRMIDAGEFLEWAGVFGRRYGTPRRWVCDRLAEGRLVILEIDVQGARAVKHHLPGALAVFILPPDEQVLLDRLRARRREPEEIIQRRFAQARQEIAAAQAGGVYDAFIVNADLDDAIRRTLEHVRARLAGRA